MVRVIGQQGGGFGCALVVVVVLLLLLLLLLLAPVPCERRLHRQTIRVSLLRNHLHPASRSARCDAACIDDVHARVWVGGCGCTWP